jgi:hypothetical protein
VSYLTQMRALPPYKSTVTNGYQRDMEAGMLVRAAIHLTTEAIVITVALMLGLPFFLALSLLFVGR